MRSVDAAFSVSKFATSRWSVPPFSIMILASSFTDTDPVQCNSPPSLTMISPSNVPPFHETESVTGTVEPSEGAEARTGAQKVTALSITIARNVAVRMFDPRQRRKSILLYLVRYILPANSIANQVE